ncbi:MAG: sugar phosphate isomerase/epimerase [Planctomycetes bacterium]|nr:sugar phosphate isomerase/epimerase [Planctomycetota bacterium]
MYRALSAGAVGVSLPVEECVKLAKQFGFAGIYLDARWVAGIGPGPAAEVLDGLRPACFGLPLDYRADTAQFTEDVLEFAELAEGMAALGCTRCSTWVPSWHDEMDFDENFQFHRRRMQWIANTLAEYNISLGLEFIGPKTSRDGHKYEFVHTMPEMLRLCREVGPPNLGVLLDSWHWYTSGGTIEELRKLKPQQVVDVHINDAPAGIPVDEQQDHIRAMPGATGVIDLKGFLGTLKSIGYKGPVMAEPFCKDMKELPPEEAVAATAAAFDAVWPD